MKIGGTTSLSKMMQEHTFIENVFIQHLLEINMLLRLGEMKTLSSYGLAFELELKNGYSVFKSAVDDIFIWYKSCYAMRDILILRL